MESINFEVENNGFYTAKIFQGNHLPPEMENEVPLTISSPQMSEKSATSELRQEQVSAQPNRILSILKMK